ncbi:MAG: methyltransferase domain-containing protein [Candidatus Kerfeldbacteria bacterium]|nr:methyltransferase domain-containing protein [Candidatus Kerfeldbacteria bacterium]
MLEEKQYQYAFVFGSHPELSMAELEAVLTQQGLTILELRRHQQICFVHTREAIDAGNMMNLLGGTVKIVEMCGKFDEEILMDWLMMQINTETKFHFGFSVYALEAGVSLNKYLRVIHALGLQLKKIFKAAGISARFVSAKEVVLSSVIVHKERLLKNGVEVVLFKSHDGLLFGKTLAVQPFQEFSRRDYGRPSRDFRSGMLPPKLARMMVNLARPTAESVVLDPFCGSGTVLQEALLLGYTHVIGSDISEKAIADTRENLAWMKFENIPLFVTDARDLIKNHTLPEHSVDRMVFEGFLGKPTPRAEKIPGIIQELRKLYTETFPVLVRLLKPNGHIVAALPYWYANNASQFLPIEQMLKSAGLRLERSPLFYRRPQSTVGRQILIMVK